MPSNYYSHTNYYSASSDSMTAPVTPSQEFFNNPMRSIQILGDRTRPTVRLTSSSISEISRSNTGNWGFDCMILYPDQMLAEQRTQLPQFRLDRTCPRREAANAGAKPSFPPLALPSVLAPEEEFPSHYKPWRARHQKAQTEQTTPS